MIRPLLVLLWSGVLMAAVDGTSLAVSVPVEPSTTWTESTNPLVNLEQDKKYLPTCTICNSTITLIEKLDQVGNISLDIIEASAKIACAMHYGPSVAPACNVIVNRVDDVLKWLGTGISIQNCCERLGLCPPTKMEMKENEIAPTQIIPSIEACASCEKITQFLEYAITLDSKEIPVIRKELEDDCMHVAEGAVCHLLLEHFDVFVKLLEDGVAPHVICQKLKFCQSSEIQMKEEIFALSAPTIEVCGPCEKVTQILEVAVAMDKKEVPVIRKELEDDCLHVAEGVVCHLLLEHFDVFVKLLEDSVAPQVVCQKLKFCPSNLISDQNERLDLIGAMYGLEAIEEQNTVMSNQQNQDAGSVSCSACKLSIDLVREKIEDSNTPVSVIEDGMSLICSILPKEYDCKTFLGKAEKIVSMIQDSKSSEECCVRLDICASIASLELNDPRDIDHDSFFQKQDDDMVIFNPLPLTTMGKELESAIDPACTFCISAAMVVQAVSENHPSGLPSVKRSLQVGCAVLPPAVECDGLVSKFDALVTLLEDGKNNPSSACRGIHQCPKSSFRVEEDWIITDNEGDALTATTREQYEILAVE